MMLLALAALLAASPPVETLLPGTYANEQQVVAAAAPWTGARITADGAGFRFQPIDAFGTSTAAPERWQVTQTDSLVTLRAGRCRRDFARVTQGLTIINASSACAGMAGPTSFTDRGMAMMAADGTPIEMQRVRAFTCTASIPRHDGTVWSGTGLILHDAGGRALAVTDEASPQRFMLRLWRNAWPLGDEVPSLTLSVHAGDLDHRIASSSADPVATRIGIALPGIAARCALAG